VPTSFFGGELLHERDDGFQRRVGAPVDPHPAEIGALGFERLGALARAGRYRSMDEGLQVKEVWVGSGETRRRFVVCRYQEEVRRDQTVASARSASPAAGRAVQPALDPAPPAARGALLRGRARPLRQGGMTAIYWS
jgi:hypothetical protein